jgi:hypothetical protein
VKQGRREAAMGEVFNVDDEGRMIRDVYGAVPAGAAPVAEEGTGRRRAGPPSAAEALDGGPSPAAEVATMTGMSETDQGAFDGGGPPP